MTQSTNKNYAWVIHNRPPDRIPPLLRRWIRFLTGGDDITARFMRGLAWKYRVFLSLSVGSSLLAAVFEGSTMAILTAALEYVAGQAGGTDIIPAFNPYIESVEASLGQQGVFIILVLLAITMQICRSWLDFLSKVGEGYLIAWSEGDVRRRLFNQFTALNYQQVSQYKVGDLASIVGEVSRLGDLINRSNQFLSHLTIVLAYTLVLFWLSWPLTLGASLGLLILSFSLRGVRRGVRSRSQQFVNAYVVLNEYIVEFLSGMQLLHTFNRQEFARKKVAETVTEGIRFRRQSFIIHSLVPPIVQSFTVIGVAIFLIFGYLWVQRTGEVSWIPRLVTFVVIVYRMLPRVNGANNTLALIYEYLPFATRIATVLETKDKVYLTSGSTPFSEFQSELVFDNISLSYDNNQPPVLNNLSLAVKPGQMIALVGASGSGKSSIVNLLMRLYKPTEGKILVDGTDLQVIKRKDWLDRLGIVNQDTFILYDTVKENIRFGKLTGTDDEIITAAKAANAHDFIMDLPNGYETIVGNRGQKLSGGQRQRLAIARAILREPQILILDEATSALDSHAESLIQAAVEHLRQERTIIVVAHRLSTVSDADQIVVLNNGQMVEQGTHSELIEQKGRYHAMWLLQRN